MERILASLVVVVLWFSAGIVCAEQPAADAVIESISYEKDDQKHEKIVFKLNGAHIPKIFTIKGERPRLVFDFIDTRYSDLINRITDTKGDLITGVRVGIHDNPPKTRVVVDLKAEEDVQFEQDFVIEENLLTITFYPGEEPSPGKTTATAEPMEKPAAPSVEEKTLVEAEPVGPEAPETLAEDQPQPDKQPAVADSAPGQHHPAPPARVTETVPVGEPPPEKSGGMLSEEVAAKPVVDPILRAVSFEEAADGNEMVLFKLNDFYPPIVFGIEKGNPRVVCDFLDTELDSSVLPTIETGGDFVQRVRVARHSKPAKVRVVLDLVPNRNYDLQQVFFKDDNLFVIVINEFKDQPAASPPPIDLKSVQ